MGNIGNGVINTFIDGDIVSANGTAPALLRSALNPKMQIIQTAIDDNDSRIAILEGQLASIVSLSVQYNVKAAPFNAVGNGIVDDTAAIQAAVSAAVLAKGVVVFPYGIYKITSSIDVTNSILIKSTGDYTTATIKQFTADTPIFKISSGTSITDLTFDAVNGCYNKGIIDRYASASNVLITRCKFMSSNSVGYTAISLTEFSNFIITNNISESATTTPRAIFTIYSCSSGLISNNIFNSPANAVMIGTLTSALPTGIVVENNKIYNANANNGGIIQTYGATNCSISKNLIVMSNPSYYSSCINVSGGFSPAVGGVVYSEDITVFGNILDCGGSQNGIAANIEYSNRILFLGNLIKNAASSIVACAMLIGGSASSVNVSDNIFYKIGRDAVGAPKVAAINISAAGYNYSIVNNSFIDMIGNSLGTGACISLTQPTGSSYHTISGNKLYRWTTTATSVNSLGIVFSTVGGSWTSHKCVYYSDNDFSKATTPMSGVPSVFAIFYRNLSGNVVAFSSTGAAPTVGTWVQGDKVVIDSPTAGGYIGYVCTTAGTPGTWKGYGAIQA